MLSVTKPLPNGVLGHALRLGAPDASDTSDTSDTNTQASRSLRPTAGGHAASPAWPRDNGGAHQRSYSLPVSGFCVQPMGMP